VRPSDSDPTNSLVRELALCSRLGSGPNQRSPGRAEVPRNSVTRTHLRDRGPKIRSPARPGVGQSTAASPSTRDGRATERSRKSMR
jgi:hypothetical protein